MWTLGEPLSRTEICDRLGIAWSERAVVRSNDGSIAIIIKQNDPVYVNIYEPQLNRLTMQGRDDVRGEWLEDPASLIRLCFRFSGQPQHQYLGRVRFVGSASWGTAANPARIFELLGE
jgi:hypothetical protein